MYVIMVTLVPLRGALFYPTAEHTVSVNCGFGSVFVKIKIYRTVILPVVLYGCETWSLTLRE